MRKYILGTLFSLCLLLSPVFTPPAEAAALTPVQISAIIGLLQAFGADQSVIANVQTALGGGSTTPSGTSPTALITVNGQPSVTNADPLVSRTWAWSGTPGATYSASGNITGCENASQNGPQSNWTPWTDTKATGTATNGSSSVIPGAVKYGCVIVGTYKVTKGGNTTTSNATITYRHANGSATTPPSQTSATKVSFALNEYVEPGSIPSNQYNLGFWGGTDLTCSLVSGQLPPGVSMVSIEKISDTGHKGCALVGVASQVGIYKITWKGTGKQYLEDAVSSLSGDLEITVYEPAETYRISPQDTLPSATVGKPYYFKFRVITTGNPNITYARFGERGSVLFSLGLKLDDITGEITGTPTTAGTYKINELDYGVSTFDHMSGSISPQFVVKPREQTQAEVNADIVSVINDPAHPWTTATSAQSAVNLKAKMLASGWTFDDVVVAIKSAGYTWNMGSIATILYPDAWERGWVLSAEIDKVIKTLGWSSANQQSTLSFRTIMITNGWTPADVCFGQPPLSGSCHGVEKNAILSVVLITSLSPSGGKVGTTVTINGSGFTGTNNISLDGNPVDTLNTSGGSYPSWISFVIPANLSSCLDRLCPLGPALTPGSYTVSVQNTNGTSNAVSLGVN